MKKLIIGFALILSLAGCLDNTDILTDARKAYTKRDYVQAIKLFRPIAEKGNAEAQFNLGIMYYRGDGVGQNPQEAMRWYRLAAEQGHAEAQAKIRANEVQAAVAWAGKLQKDADLNAKSLKEVLVADAAEPKAKTNLPKRRYHI